MIRSLPVARATAMKARTQAINALKALVVTAPDELREQLHALSAVRLVQTAASLEPGPVTTPAAAATLGLRTLGRRYQVRRRRQPRAAALQRRVLARRIREGKSKKEAIRCLQR
jgi:hypothetical protein